MRAVFAAVILAVCGTLASDAGAQQRIAIWSGWEDDGYGGAVDCTDCFEDEYVALTCERGGDTVAVELIGLPSGDPPTTPPGARLPVTLDIDGVAETRPAVIEETGMFGPIPLLTLAVDDPLFARLRAGTVLTLAAAGDRLEIPLAGIGEALDVMVAACR